MITGARKAREASQERVRRLAQVVVSGLIRLEDSEEQVLEFLRFASELNETDIHVLNQMYIAQREFRIDDLGVWAMNIRRVMHDKAYLNRCGEDIDNQHVRAAFARLQALGLVQQFGGTAADTGPAEQHYAVLAMGKEFVEYLKIAAS